jgi:hypothetical protein
MFARLFFALFLLASIHRTVSYELLSQPGMCDRGPSSPSGRRKSLSRAFGIVQTCLFHRYHCVVRLNVLYIKCYGDSLFCIFISKAHSCSVTSRRRPWNMAVVSDLLAFGNTFRVSSSIWLIYVILFTFSFVSFAWVLISLFLRIWPCISWRFRTFFLCISQHLLIYYLGFYRYIYLQSVIFLYINFVLPWDLELSQRWCSDFTLMLHSFGPT